METPIIGLETLVLKYLSEKNTNVYCLCGNRRAHSLIYCSYCGGKFSNGYSPKTVGESIKWLINKPNRNMTNPIKFHAALILYTTKREISNSITVDDISEIVEANI